MIFFKYIFIILAIPFTPSIASAENLNLHFHFRNGNEAVLMMDPDDAKVSQLTFVKRTGGENSNELKVVLLDKEHIVHFTEPKLNIVKSTENDVFLNSPFSSTNPRFTWFTTLSKSGGKEELKFWLLDESGKIQFSPVASKYMENDFVHISDDAIFNVQDLSEVSFTTFTLPAVLNSSEVHLSIQSFLIKGNPKHHLNGTFITNTMNGKSRSIDSQFHPYLDKYKFSWLRGQYLSFPGNGENENDYIDLIKDNPLNLPSQYLKQKAKLEQLKQKPNDKEAKEGVTKTIDDPHLEWMMKTFDDLVGLAKMEFEDPGKKTHLRFYEKIEPKMLEQIRRNLIARKSVVALSSSPLLSSSVLNAFVREVALGRIPGIPSDSMIFRVDPHEFEGNYSGEYGERLKHLLSVGRKYPNAYFVFSPVSNLAGIGTHSQKSIDMTLPLTHAMLRQEIVVLGSDTFFNFKNSFSKTKGFLEEFYKININDLNKNEISQFVRDTVELKYGMKMDPEVLNKAVSMATEFDPLSSQPEASLGLIEQCIQGIIEARNESAEKFKSDERLARLEKVESKDEKGKDKDIPMEELNPEITLPGITLNDLENTAKDRYNFDLAYFDKREIGSRLRDLEEGFRGIVGQELAKQAMIELWRNKFTGFVDPEDEINSLLFVGPPGVGKTFIAETSAKLLKSNYTLIAMNQYANGDIDAFLEEVQAALLRSPFHVIILDEIERASIRVQNAALQMLQSGRFSVSQKDSRGNPVGKQVINAKQALFVMTSNAAEEYVSETLRLGKKIDNEILVALLEEKISNAILSRVQEIVPMGLPNQEQFIIGLKRYIERCIRYCNEKGNKVFILQNPEEFAADMKDLYYGKKTDYRMIKKIVNKKFRNFLSKIATESSNFEKSEFKIRWDKDRQNFEVLY